jgi:hypothetical protein
MEIMGQKNRKNKFYKSSLKEKHGETCMCKRCRARQDALERKPVRFIRLLELVDFPTNEEQFG